MQRIVQSENLPGNSESCNITTFGGWDNQSGKDDFSLWMEGPENVTSGTGTRRDETVPPCGSGKTLLRRIF